MGTNRLWVGVLFILVVGGCWPCDGCLEEERVALLQLKTFFNLLTDWDQGDDSSSDCCLWKRVECNTTIRRVTTLDLEHSRQWNSENDIGYLNASLFISFLELKSLSLSHNGIGDCVENEGFQKLSSKLDNLKMLNLSFNYFNNNILPSLAGFSSLKSLFLASNNFSGSMDISGGLCDMIHLEMLDISGNNLAGALPWCLANMTSLEKLNLGSNQFSGDIIESPLKSLISLQVLSLFDNQFRIPISFEPLFNHSKLKEFYSSNNEIYADENLQLLAPKFQLNKLSLYSVGFVGGPLPKFLNSQHELLEVYLVHTHFIGEFPCWLVENNTNLQRLHLVNNSFSEPFKLPFHSHMNLKELDITYNFFDGHIPAEIGAYFPSLSYLNMSKNSFQGDIPTSIGDMKFLKMIDFTDNHLSGKIPRWMGNMSNLHGLIMLNNHLEGLIPLEFCQLNDLRVLDFSGNNISGSIPSCFSPSKIFHVHLSKNNLQGSLTTQFQNSSFLVTLDLSNNHLTGYIPNSIHRISALSYLLLNNNNFKGHIPINLCQLGKLRVINLSHNDLFGRIPSCLSITTFEEVRTMITKGPIEITTKRMSYFYKGSILKLMAGIDLSCNKLNGEIPQEIGNTTEIHVLNLSHNSLTGRIPRTFSNLKEIESLDLSYNKLIGSLPPQLIELHSLSSFNVSYNNLSGKAPERVQQFATFDESSYKGNPFLCGDPLPSCSGPGPSSFIPNLLSDNREEVGLIDIETFIVSFSITYLIVLLAIVAVLYINTYKRIV